ncbi:MAG: hypothetical protein ACRDAJ_12045 [Serratia fonticola]
MATGKCKLCRERNVKLINGHIIPDFFIKALQGEKIKGFRESKIPNRKIQDGPKKYLFCEKCDNDIISTYENYFKESVFSLLFNKSNLDSNKTFDILQSNKKKTKQFTASILLRSLYNIFLDEGVKNTPEWVRKFKHLINNQQKEWRDALLSDQEVKKADIMYVPTPSISPNDANLIDKLHLVRDINYELVIINIQNRNIGLLLFVKVGQFIFFSTISNEKIPTEHIHNLIQSVLIKSRNDGNALFESISEKQREKMKDKSNDAMDDLFS